VGWESKSRRRRRRCGEGGSSAARAVGLPRGAAALRRGAAADRGGLGSWVPVVPLVHLRRRAPWQQRGLPPAFDLVNERSLFGRAYVYPSLRAVGAVCCGQVSLICQVQA
jgi:hypothetical protein